MEIQRNSIASQANQYNSQIGNSPEQERVLTQIGRQQEVKSGLYLMLLQKREENSISLAATADKDRNQLLADALGDGVQSGARTTC
jgi:tyrosine-protein kinase Etk/Wzc